MAERISVIRSLFRLSTQDHSSFWFHTIYRHVLRVIGQLNLCFNYSTAPLIRMTNAWKNHANYLCKACWHSQNIWNIRHTHSTCMRFMVWAQPHQGWPQWSISNIDGRWWCMMQVREPPWLWNPWGAQNWGNQWPHKMNLGPTKNSWWGHGGLGWVMLGWNF